MAIRSIILSAYAAVLLCAIGAPALPKNATMSDLNLPQKRSETLGIPNSAAAGPRDLDEGEEDDRNRSDEEQTETVPGEEEEEGNPPLPERAVAPSLRKPKVFAEPVGPPPPPLSAKRGGKRQDENDDEEPENASDEEDGIPPLPERAVAPSLRNPKVFSEPVGPPAPQTWSQEEIAAAQAECQTLLPEADFDFKILSPIRDGSCGAPAPVQLKGFKRDTKVDLHPPATMTCPLASALGRWMSEVVQPRAKALLESDIVQLANNSGYACRSRYHDPTQRISYHALAEAVDIGEFVTAKGEHISVLEYWPGGDKRAQFLKDIHDGACKIFGTVLGPEANAAHKTHFHLDIAKRRYSAYCQ